MRRQIDISDSDLLARVSEMTARVTGLHFPESRWPELGRGITAAAEESGYEDAVEFARALLSSPPTAVQIDALAAHLTISESYFFRDAGTFQAMADLLVPSWKDRPAGTRRRLRVWSAACCTGEEPYSVAILLHELIPDLADWDVTVLATDINPRALRVATAGIYGQWSFRNTPDHIKRGYFRPVSGGRFQVLPEIQRLVRFTKLNLVGDAYPSAASGTGAMDLILCRNVLIYFGASQARGVVEKLSRAQAEGGWLLVSAAELSYVSASAYVTVSRPGAILCRKGRAFAEPRPAYQFRDEVDVRVTTSTITPDPVARDGVEPDRVSDDSVSLYASVRAIADEGDLPNALMRCDRWIAADKLNASAHYLRSVILEEQGELGEAGRTLRRALYLDPQLVLAHFSLGRVARRGGLTSEANKHFGTAHRLASQFPDDAVLPFSGGITAGRLRKAINLMTSPRRVA